MQNTKKLMYNNHRYILFYGENEINDIIDTLELVSTFHVGKIYSETLVWENIIHVNVYGHNLIFFIV